MVYESNEINLIKLQDGTDGKPGKDGESGKTLYTWVKYSQYADGTDLTDDPTDAIYIGIAYNKEEKIESNIKTDYTWSKFKGDKGDKGDRGLQGLQGEKGEQGIPGTNGTNGKTSYFHIKYSANSNGNPMTETPNTYIGTYVDYTETDSTDYTKYTWSRFQGMQGDKGDQGIAGTNGTNGETSYLHIAYATSADGSQGFSVSDSVNKTYIGQYTDFIESDSTDYKQYKWSKIKGEDGYTPVKGVDYFDGTNGKDGTSSYLWVRYATDSSGSGMTATPSSSTTYIGTTTTTSSTAPTSASSYKWSKYVGSDGIPGEKGNDGKTAYLHIAYANSADGKTGFDISDGTGKLYIGQYTDNISTDSTDPTKYTWTKIKGEDGQDGTNGKDGNDGRGIKSTSTTYQASTSGTTIPTDTWSTSIPSVSAGSYLWTRTIVTYTDSTTSTSYSVSMMGATGATGKGVSKIVEQYYLSSSNTTQTDGSWSTTSPSWKSGYYIWTRSHITWTDGSITYTTPVLSNALNDANSTANNALDTVNNLEIGGRNLLLGTKDFSHAMTNNVFSKTIDENGFIVYTGTGNGAYPIIHCLSIQNAIDNPLLGKTIVLSLDIKADDLKTTPSNYSIGLQIAGSNDGFVTFKRTLYNTSYLSGTSGFKLISSELIDDEWCRLKYSYTIPEFSAMPGSLGTYDEYRYAMAFYLNSSNIGHTASVRKFKMELGNKATDWSPAPEDISVENIYTPNTTTIDGGKITTNSINASSIDVNSIFAKDITATGTITGATLRGAHVESDSGRIGGWDITSDKLFKNTEKQYADYIGDYIPFGELGTDGWAQTYYGAGVWITAKSSYFRQGYRVIDEYDDNGNPTKYTEHIGFEANIFGMYTDNFATNSVSSDLISKSTGAPEPLPGGYNNIYYNIGSDSQPWEKLYVREINVVKNDVLGTGGNISAQGDIIAGLGTSNQVSLQTLNSNLNNLKIKSVPFTLTSDTTYKACFTSQEDFEQKSGVPYSKIVWLGAYCTNANTQPDTYINKNNNVLTITNLPTANKTYNFWVTIIYK